METIKPTDAEQAVKGVACQISVTTQLTEKRHIVIQSYMDRDAPIRDYHSLLDKLGAATDRQEAKYRLDGLKADLEVHKKTLGQLTSDHERIEGTFIAQAEADWVRRGKKGPVRLAPEAEAKMKAGKGNTEQNIKQYRQAITKLETEIARCEATIAKVD